VNDATRMRVSRSMEPPEVTVPAPATPAAAPPRAWPAVPRTATEALDLGRLYRDHAEDVSRWARRLLGPDGDAEDVVHEVFMVAQRRLREFRGDARPGTWLYAITVRVVQHQRRKGRWWRLLRSRPALEPAEAPTTPLETLESRRAVELTYRLLDGLPEAERSALILFEIEGLSGEAIAALTGEAVGTIWVRLHRARARFRKAYQAWRAAGGRQEEGR
jgi:RNA polymerase sigma factor (sigma-70 family)